MLATVICSLTQSSQSEVVLACTFSLSNAKNQLNMFVVAVLGYST